MNEITPHWLLLWSSFGWIMQLKETVIFDSEILGDWVHQFRAPSDLLSLCPQDKHGCSYSYIHTLRTHVQGLLMTYINTTVCSRRYYFWLL